MATKFTSIRWPASPAVYGTAAYVNGSIKSKKRKKRVVVLQQKLPSGWMKVDKDKTNDADGNTNRSVPRSTGTPYLQNTHSRRLGVVSIPRTNDLYHRSRCWQQWDKSGSQFFEVCMQTGAAIETICIEKLVH